VNVWVTNAKNWTKRFVGGWSTRGYPLEFIVAKKFQANGFAVRQGSYLNDPNADAREELM